MIHLDTETCGLVGPIVLIQYAEDDGSVTLHEVFHERTRDTIRLIERFSDNVVCGFNLAFDWFHINKLYNILQAIEDKSIPPRINIVANNSTRNNTKFCVKPVSALDLMLHARKTILQNTMGRDDIRIKKVPMELARQLASELTKRIDLPEIYFYYRALGYEWIVEHNEDDPKFCDIILKWGASGGLKPICSHVFKTKFIDYPIPKHLYPKEKAYNPYDTQWLDVIVKHIWFWRNNREARGYAETDVLLLQRLYHYFGEPEHGDTDSLLACAVGSIRWRGFEIDAGKCRARRCEKERLFNSTTVNVNSHVQVKRYLKASATEIESSLITGTGADILDALRKFDSETGRRADEVIRARAALKEINILDKLLETGRFCPEFKVIGARSGRMSGGGSIAPGNRKGGSLNPQGIQRDPTFRALFTLSEEGSVLSGGDFDAFEITIADAEYDDPNLRSALRSGQKFHAIFGEILHELPQDEILATKGTSDDKYYSSKQGALATLYGAMSQQLARTTGVSEESAERTYKEFFERFDGIRKAREIISKRFCSISQPGGIGTAIIWKDPDSYIESMLGFRRYFTLENSIVKSIFQLAQNPPDSFDIFGKCWRRGREQTIKGATQSALYAIAFQLQARNMRAAANHRIQSTGAQITKEVQAEIWKLQPVGIHEWRVRTLNIHDEIMCVHDPAIGDAIKMIVDSRVESYREMIPLIKMDWKIGLKDWSDK